MRPQTLSFNYKADSFIMSNQMKLLTFDHTASVWRNKYSFVTRMSLSRKSWCHHSHCESRLKMSSSLDMTLWTSLYYLVIQIPQSVYSSPLHFQFCVALSYFHQLFLMWHSRHVFLVVLVNMFSNVHVILTIAHWKLNISSKTSGQVLVPQTS